MDSGGQCMQLIVDNVDVCWRSSRPAPRAMWGILHVSLSRVDSI